MKVSYTSKVFLQQDRIPNGNGEAAAEEMTSHLVKTKRSPRYLDAFLPVAFWVNLMKIMLLSRHVVLTIIANPAVHILALRSYY